MLSALKRYLGRVLRYSVLRVSSTVRPEHVHVRWGHTSRVGTFVTIPIIGGLVVYVTVLLKIHETYVYSTVLAESVVGNRQTNVVPARRSIQ